MGARTTPRLLVIGLDGATFDVIRPMVARGKLPNLSRLMETGISGPLTSTIHPITPMAWTSFLTGVNPGRHGVYDFTAREEGSYRMKYESGGSRRSSTFLSWLSDQDVSVGCVAVPFTYPPEKVKGYVLAGLDAPSEDHRACNPPEIYDELKSAVGAYYIYLASPVGRKPDLDAFRRDMEIEDRNRTDVVRYLHEHHPTDVSVVVYQNTDRVSHLFYHDGSGSNGAIPNGIPVVEEVYERTDAELGRLLEGLPEDAAVVVLSDHGSGSIQRVFQLNGWLDREGYLAYHPSSLGIGQRMARASLAAARFASKRLLPRGAKNVLKTRLPWLKDRTDSYLSFAGVDWSRTRAYGFGIYGNVFVNLRGREPEGIVEPGPQYESLLEEIAAKLRALRDPDTDEPVVERVYRGSELFDGPYAHKAPDLLIEWKDYAIYTSTAREREVGPVFRGPEQFDSSGFAHVGTHRIDGIFIASGPAFGRGTLTSGAHIVDVAPTLLCALRAGIPSGLDGRVLDEVFDPAFLESNPPRFLGAPRQDGAPDDGGPGDDYDDEEARKIRERLEGLGYL